MRVLLIDVNCKYSSTGEIVYDIYRAVNSKGDEAAVCYGRGQKIRENNIFKFGIDIETYLHALLTRLTGYTGCFSPISTMRLLRFIKKFKPDIVHIHELHAYFVNIKSLLNFLKKNKIPVVHTLHCEFSYTGKCGHADECQKWMTECDKCPKVKEYPQSMFFDHTKSMFNDKKKSLLGLKKMVITTPSEWVTSRAKQSFLKECEIITIHNGIDTQVFFNRKDNDIRKKYGISDQQKIVLSVAPNILSERKGGKFILQCAEQMDHREFFFILVGDSSETKTTQGNVLILPRILDKEELAAFYSAADVFVLCSKKETFSLTCAEALCCDTPVVGFKCGAPEMIFDEPYAKFVEYGDVEQLVKLIKESVTNTNTSEISIYAHNKFSKKTMVERYCDVYERIAK